MKRILRRPSRWTSRRNAGPCGHSNATCYRICTGMACLKAAPDFSSDDQVGRHSRRLRTLLQPVARLKPAGDFLDRNLPLARVVGTIWPANRGAQATASVQITVAPGPGLSGHVTIIFADESVSATAFSRNPSIRYLGSRLERPKMRKFLTNKQPSSFVGNTPTIEIRICCKIRDEAPGWPVDGHPRCALR